jgi:hypothetical protein
VTAFWRFSASAALLLVASGSAATLTAQDLPPVGFGTLRQDQVAVRLTTANLSVRVLPLDERVIRLLAPDTYSSLLQLKRSRADDIAAAAGGVGTDSATAFVVTFFGLQPDTRFDPDQLYLSSQNTFFRPVGVVPLTPRWSEGTLGQREQAVAIYLFQPGIPVLQPFTLFYGDRQSGAWETSLRTLESERSRVLGRAAARQP